MPTASLPALRWPWAVGRAPLVFVLAPTRAPLAARRARLSARGGHARSRVILANVAGSSRKAGSSRQVLGVPRRAVAATLLAAAATGCSLVTSFDGFTGSDASGPGDGATQVDGESGDAIGGDVG